MAQVQREIEHYRADALYLAGHREELLRQYPDRWVAIYDLRVVADAKHLSRLIKQLDRRGFPRGDVVVEYLATDEPLLIVAAE